MTFSFGRRSGWWQAGLLALLLMQAVQAGDMTAIGLATSGRVVEAQLVEATVGAPLTVVLLGGLTGDAQSAAAVRNTIAAYEQQRTRPWRILAVARVNPDVMPLRFPPTGVAYRQNAESHVLWRWLGTQAPDLVLVAGDDPAGLVQALDSQQVADMGRIPAQPWAGTLADLQAHTAGLTRSPAHAERDRRLARTPRQVAQLLARHYGQEFDQPWYIGAIALVARSQLGDVADVQRLVEPYVDGRKDSLARANSLVLAGHIVFTDLARRTADPRYVQAVRKVADLGFDAAGQMRESMPYHEQYSDSVFMGTAIVAQAGALTGERRYFDMADRHLRFMQALVLRDDGLYRHQPATDAAWGAATALPRWAWRSRSLNCR